MGRRQGPTELSLYLLDTVLKLDFPNVPFAKLLITLQVDGNINSERMTYHIKF